MGYGNFRGGGGYGGGSFGRDSSQQTVQPVSVGEEIDVKIEAVGEKGDGIARKKGFVLFVPGVKEGEEVRIKVTKVLRKVGFAEVLGPAQGPVETSQPSKRPMQRQQEALPPAPEQPAEPHPEDSENFGEEEPAEKPAEGEEELEDAPEPSEEELEQWEEKQ
jgi:predicted RNA-binding protein with TRAM domain